MFDWQLTPMNAERQVDTEQFFASDTADYLHIFDYHGRRVTRRDLDWDDWRNWQAELNVRLRAAIAFLYGNFVRGVWNRRFGSQKVRFAIPPRYTKEDVLFLKRLLEAGEYRAVVDRTYRMEDAVEAARYVETEQKTGNVILTIAG